MIESVSVRKSVNSSPLGHFLLVGKILSDLSIDAAPGFIGTIQQTIRSIRMVYLLDPQERSCIPCLISFLRSIGTVYISYTVNDQIQLAEIKFRNIVLSRLQAVTEIYQSAVLYIYVFLIVNSVPDIFPCNGILVGNCRIQRFRIFAVIKVQYQAAICGNNAARLIIRIVFIKRIPVNIFYDSIHFLVRCSRLCAG